MKPNFAAMTCKQLREYVLAHRNDEEAFFAYVDRSASEANWAEFPPVESVEELQHFPVFLDKLRKETQSDS
jgi:hypothetical protein